MRTFIVRIFFICELTQSALNLEEFGSSKYAKQPHFLLIGNPVSHSLSPLMHNTAAEYHELPIRYHALSLERSELGSFAAYLNNDQLKGVNITIPYKKMMMEYVDECSEEARQIAAINTIVKKGSQLIGHNTDTYGFLKPLGSYEDELKDSRVIIFGTGGASKAIVHGLQQWGVQEIVLVSRKPTQKETEKWPGSVRFYSYDSWPSVADEAAMIINATPLGMEPNVSSCPVRRSEQPYLADRICYDIVYKPQRTAFLEMAASAGARTIGGLEMLIQQGSRSFELWTGKPFPLDLIRNTLKEHLNHAD